LQRLASVVAIALPAQVRALGRSAARYRRPAGWVFNAAVIVYAGYEIWRLGLGAVLRSLPVNPLFYLIYLVHFSATPAAERLIYALIWPGERRVPIAVLLRKRVMNAVLISYSGEVWFFLWARQRLGVPARQIASTVKDSSILSGLALAVATVVLATWAVLTGAGQVLVVSVGDHWRAIVVAILVAAFLLPVLFRFRKRLFFLSTRLLFIVLGIHTVRLIATQMLQALQWALVMPQVSFDVWLLFLTVQLLILQIPLIPNPDLLFLAVGVRLTGSVGVSQADLAALLLATTIFKQVTNLGTLAVSTLLTAGEGPSDAEVARETEKRAMAQPVADAD
jgi:hypothetical protein